MYNVFRQVRIQMHVCNGAGAKKNVLVNRSYVLVPP